MTFIFGYLIVIVTGLTYNCHTMAERHPCDRPCVSKQSKTCIYKFEIEKAFTMSKSCYNCPYNVDDCYRPKCITANGITRIIYVANHQMPGPIISVCENDEIVVDVVNRMSDETTSIHWHGILQNETQYNDGVPFVTQCPIGPYGTFRYQFTVKQSGTHFWHSHTGYQVLDGLFGLFIIRQPPNVDPNYEMYDFDMNEHSMIVSDWHSLTGEVMHGLSYTTKANLTCSVVPFLLVNGRGQGQTFKSPFPFFFIDNYTPIESFTVKEGYRYRFRFCSNANIVCPVQVSVDDHLLTVIAVDGNPVKPRVVSSIHTYPGERYDFVINANRSFGNYLIRFQGIGVLCTGAYIAAILKYEDSPKVSLTKKYITPILNIQPLSDVMQFNSMETQNVRMQNSPDVQLHLQFSSIPDLKPKDEPWFGMRLLLPSVNGIAMTYPSSPMLSQLNDINETLFCNESSIGKNCQQEYCSCIHRILIPLNSEVELVLINTGLDPFRHDVHLHGHTFYVISQGNLAAGDNTVETFKRLDMQNRIPRNLINPVIKDTVNIPPAGYTIVRFKADNPGFWMLHCHMTFHFEAGMGLVLQVGNPLQDVPPVPIGFPRCGNYLPPIN